MTFPFPSMIYLIIHTQIPGILYAALLHILPHLITYLPHMTQTPIPIYDIISPILRPISSPISCPLQ